MYAQKIVALQTPINTVDVHMAISNESPCKHLVKKIDRIIEESINNGTLQKFINGYID